MSTNCLIGVMHGDKIKTIYCHFDGYLEGVGATLLEHYDSPKANQLVALGDISFLEKNIEIPEGVDHSFETPASGITVFYGRDRGEENVSFKTHCCEAEFNMRRGNFSYVYLMISDNWYYLPYGTKLENKVSLKNALSK